MKDTHNVILIVVSSKWSSFFFCIVVHHVTFLGSRYFIFSFPEFQVPALSHREAPSKSWQGFTLCFQLLFLFIILLLPELFMEALHDGSSRILFILQLFFKISLGILTRQAILQIKHGAQHMFCFEAFKHSSSCIPKCNSSYLISWYGVMSFLTISFMFHDSQVVKNEIF